MQRNTDREDGEQHRQVSPVITKYNVMNVEIYACKFGFIFQVILDMT
jgi:hypothetical protein